MIDVHAHILPGLDDGPETMDDALALARVAVESGTTTLSATSHVNRGFGLGPAELRPALAALRARLEREEIPLDVVQGGEISAARLGELDDDFLRGVALGGGPWLLLECPLSSASPPLEAMVADLHGRGFEVLLAHPERSPTIQQEPALLARLVEIGALAQVTAGSFVGAHGELARHHALRQLGQGLVHVIASDAHDHVHRPPEMLIGLAAIGDRFEDADGLVEWMTLHTPRAILAGERVPERPHRAIKA